MNLASEAKVEQELVQTPEGQQVIKRRIVERIAILISLIVGIGLFLLWLPEPIRDLFLRNLIDNRLVIVSLFLFSLISVSLLWSLGQRIDVWLFNALNLRGYHSVWMDRAMWLATQIGSSRFTAVLAVGAYALGQRGLAFALGLGSLLLWLLV